MMKKLFKIINVLINVKFVGFLSFGWNKRKLFLSCKYFKSVYVVCCVVFLKEFLKRVFVFYLSNFFNYVLNFRLCINCLK